MEIPTTITHMATPLPRICYEELERANTVFAPCIHTTQTPYSGAKDEYVVPGGGAQFDWRHHE